MTEHVLINSRSRVVFHGRCEPVDGHADRAILYVSEGGWKERPVALVRPEGAAKIRMLLYPNPNGDPYSIGFWVDNLDHVVEYVLCDSAQKHEMPQWLGMDTLTSISKAFDVEIVDDMSDHDW